MKNMLKNCILNSILFRFSIFVDFFRFFAQEVQHSKLKKKFSGRNFCQTIFSKQKISAQRQKNKKVLYSAFRHLSWLTIFEKKIFFYKLWDLEYCKNSVHKFTFFTAFFMDRNFWPIVTRICTPRKKNFFFLRLMMRVCSKQKKFFYFIHYLKKKLKF